MLTCSIDFNHPQVEASQLGSSRKSDLPLHVPPSSRGQIQIPERKQREKRADVREDGRLVLRDSV